MVIKTAVFVSSYTHLEEYPKSIMPEYAFIGRSNVGKSSLVNMLTGKDDLARTSPTPGKTQTINHYLINDNWYLADLPGYGFANAPIHVRNDWERMNSEYILNRTNLLTLFVLIDIRIPPQESDLDFIESLVSHKVPFALIFTKSDKLKKNAVDSQVKLFKTKLKAICKDLPPDFITSAIMKTGRGLILNFIEESNAKYRRPGKFPDTNE